MSEELLNEEESSKKLNILNLDLRIFYITLKRRAPLIAGGTILFLLLAAGLSQLLIKKRWRATCILVKHERESNPKTDMPYLYRSLDMNTILETVRIKENRERVIEELELELTDEELFKLIEVRRGRKSNIIMISATYAERELSVEIANRTAEVFLDSYVELLNSSVLKIYDYYKGQRELVILKIKEIEAKEEAYKKEYGIISFESELELKYKQLEGMEVKLLENRMLIEDLRIKIKDIDELIPDLPEEVKLTTLVRMKDEQRLAELEKELEEAEKKYTDENPTIINIREEIRKVSARIADAGESSPIPDAITYGDNRLRSSLLIESTNYALEVESAKRRINDLESSIETLKGELTILSKIEVGYLEIKRELEVQRDLLKTVENRMTEARIVAESNVNDFEIIEQATPPKYPLSTSKKLITLAAGVLGLGLLLFLVLLSELADFRVKSKYDYDHLFEIPLIGQLPQIEEGREGQTRLYSNLQLIADYLLTESKRGPGLIILGSGRRGTGKSLLTEELIKLLSSQDYKILYIESKPDSPGKDDKSYRYGINRLLYEKRPLKMNSIRLGKRAFKNYFFIDERVYKEMLKGEELEHLLERLNDYRLVIWEIFEPSLNLQLFSTIMESSALFVLVSAFRRSGKMADKELLDYLRSKGFTKIAGVLNRVPGSYFDDRYMLH